MSAPNERERKPALLTTEERLTLLAHRQISSATYSSRGWDLAGDVAVVLARLESCRGAYKQALGREFD